MIDRYHLKSHVMIAGAIAIAIGFAQPVGSQANDPYVVLQTTQGNIRIRVFESRVPQTADNFLDLVSHGYYNGNRFHRIETWCVQTGDPTGTGRGNFVDPQTGQPRFIPLEINPQYHHDRPGIVAMARSGDPNSASAQFYITKAAMPNLNGQYAIFGGVVQGVDVVMRLTRADSIISATIEHPNPPANTSSPAPPGARSPSGNTINF